MSTLPVDQVVGFAQQSREMLNTYKTEMTAKGFDPTSLMASLDTKATALVGKNQEQEAAKTTLRILTEETDAQKDDTQRTASSACDSILAAFGRTSQQGKEATNLRKSITGPVARHTTGGTPPTPPTP